MYHCIKLPAKQKCKTKPWFTSTYYQIKNEVRSLSKLLSKTLNDVHLRATFYTVKHNLKHIVKTSRAKYKQSLIEKLENASETETSAFWKILSELRTLNNENYKTNTIPVEEWVDHFKDLFKEPKM